MARKQQAARGLDSPPPLVSVWKLQVVYSLRDLQVTLFCEFLLLRTPATVLVHLIVSDFVIQTFSKSHKL